MNVRTCLDEHLSSPSAEADFSAGLKSVVVCVYLLSEWRHRLVEAGLALCGPQHCRVMNDLMAGEVSSVLTLSRCTQAFITHRSYSFSINWISKGDIYGDVCLYVAPQMAQLLHFAAVYQKRGSSLLQSCVDVNLAHF